MADGPRPAAGGDGGASGALAEEARLVRHVRWRLVAWSGLSTLVVLLVLAVTLYAVVARTLEGASIRQLDTRVESVVRLVEGPGVGDGPDYGFQLGNGNTLLYLFDERGEPVLDPRRPVAVPDGLPLPGSLAAAATTGEDVRTSVLAISNRADTAEVPVRVLTRSVVAQDGDTYFLQALQDRTTEVQTLGALLAVLVVGGILMVVVAFGFGTLYARRALVPIRESLAAQRSALRRQREFAADASHELRTPLTVIRASVEHLARHPDRPVADAREALEDIDAEVAHLTALVDDLLLLARSDSGALTLDAAPLDLGDVAFEAAGALARSAEMRGVRVEVDPEPAMVAGDRARLRQLVVILVDNAVRHSPRGGTVTVLVRAASGTAAIEVADEGPGLRESDLPHVFDRFWRAPGAPSGGTGLGLAIARWIAERHRGRIGVANRPGGGAAFRVEIPAAPVVRQAPGPLSEGERPA